MTQCEIKSGLALVGKSNDIFYICRTTSTNRAGARRLGECMGLLCCGKYECNCMAAPRSSPIAATVITKIKHVTRFVCQCVGATCHAEGVPLLGPYISYVVNIFSFGFLHNMILSDDWYFFWEMRVRLYWWASLANSFKTNNMI